MPEPVPHPSDDAALYLAARWTEARAEALLHWARQDVESLYSTKCDKTEPPPGSSIRTIERMAHELERAEPSTMRGAWVMLDVVIRILADREIDPDPGLRIAQGNILHMLRGVKAQLDWLDGDMLLGPRQAA